MGRGSSSVGDGGEKWGKRSKSRRFVFVLFRAVSRSRSFSLALFVIFFFLRFRKTRVFPSNPPTDPARQLTKSVLFAIHHFPFRACFHDKKIRKKNETTTTFENNDATPSRQLHFTYMNYIVDKTRRRRKKGVDDVVKQKKERHFLLLVATPVYTALRARVRTHTHTHV